ncbi:MAG: hypothetical protein JNL01_03795 [Bdellovibrionales bacterium]|nr:hypothetical protein [Bdellovibrionales bacterium]
MVRAIGLSVILLWSLLSPGASAQVSQDEKLLKQRETNALKAKAVLASCKGAPSYSSGLFNQLDQGLVHGVSVGIQPTCLHSSDHRYFLNQLDQMKSIADQSAKVESDLEDSQFVAALRFETLKNVLETYVDAELRYNLNYPKKEDLSDPASIVAKVCSSSRGKNTCSESETAELKESVAQFRNQFFAKGQRTVSVRHATSVLNQELQGLNQAFKPVSEAGQFLQKQTSPKSALDRYSSGDEAVKNAIGRSYLAPEQSLYEQNYQNFLRNSQSGIGLLFYTEELRRGLGLQKNGEKRVNQSQVVSAISEIKSQSIGLAQATNDQFLDVTDRTPDRGEYLFQQSNRRNRSAVAIRRMLRTNPVAAGKVLVNQPEMAWAVCRISSKIAADDRAKETLSDSVRVAAWGGAIIGGIMALTGVLSPAGVALNSSSMAIVSTLGALDTSISTLTFMAYTTAQVQKRSDLTSDLRLSQQALISGTNGLSADSIQKKEDQIQALDREALETAMAIASPFAANVVRGSRAYQASRARDFFSRLTRDLGGKPATEKGIRVFDFTCGIAGIVACEILTSSFSTLTTDVQQRLLNHPDQFKKWASSRLEDRFSSSGNNGIRSTLIKKSGLEKKAAAQKASKILSDQIEDSAFDGSNPPFALSSAVEDITGTQVQIHFLNQSAMNKALKDGGAQVPTFYREAPAAFSDAKKSVYEASGGVKVSENLKGLLRNYGKKVQDRSDLIFVTREKSGLKPDQVLNQRPNVIGGISIVYSRNRSEGTQLDEIFGIDLPRPEDGRAIANLEGLFAQVHERDATVAEIWRTAAMVAHKRKDVGLITCVTRADVAGKLLKRGFKTIGSPLKNKEPAAEFALQITPEELLSYSTRAEN